MAALKTLRTDPLTLVYTKVDDEAAAIAVRAALISAI
jgi:hypothetical protein